MIRDTRDKVFAKSRIIVRPVVSPKSGKTSISTMREEIETNKRHVFIYLHPMEGLDLLPGNRLS